MTISYDVLINQRALGSELAITNEPHVVGILGVNTTVANTVKLIEVPLEESPSTVVITGYTEITSGSPSAGQFKVNYTTGYITFNSANNGASIQVSYKGRGSIIDAVDVNELRTPLGGIADFSGTLSAGIVSPLSISTNPADVFAFPGDVQIATTGELTYFAVSAGVTSLTGISGSYTISHTNINSQAGALLTTTADTTATLSTDVSIGGGKLFFVMNSPSSVGRLTVNGYDIPAGQGLYFHYPVASTWICLSPSIDSGVRRLASDPGSPSQGEIWFNTTDNQFKGYNGTSVVVLG